ncbi:MAG: tRNA preQ1(34) S-adenosylmethionine ribosyltransferase-isomerase QueA [Candidatus Omnitrophota bacterium]
MKLTDFDYQLPKELIAQFPLKERCSSRLLVLDRKSGQISHKNFSNILEYFHPGDSLILNDTKVIPARIFGKRKTGAKVEILLLERKDSNTFRCLIKPSRIKLGEEIALDSGTVSARVLSKEKDKNLISFGGEKDINTFIKKDGSMPLPAYIKRQAQDFDRVTYQTVYAKHDGAIAAPTAGLHFTHDLLGQIKKSGINVEFLTLHVGLGTFKPIKSDDVVGHKMEEEEFVLSKEVAGLINKTKEQGKRVFAVGTTTTRVLEAVGQNGELSTKQGKTDLFIYPGFNFKIVDCLLTNFHLPKSTLFLLVCAFAGRDLILKAYEEAIRGKYRFYSYGDAMLIV